MNLQESINRAKEIFGDSIEVNVTDKSGTVKLNNYVMFSMTGEGVEQVVTSVLHTLVVGFELGKHYGMMAAASAFKTEEIK